MVINMIEKIIKLILKFTKYEQDMKIFKGGRNDNT